MDRRKVSLNWDIHIRCNLRCPYCWFFGQWQDFYRYNIYPETSDVVRAWERIYNRHGSIKLCISGGEPFFYPKFHEIIPELSGMHEVKVITNMSLGFKDLMPVFIEKKVKVNLSFHPLSSKIGEFINAASDLNESGVLEGISFVAWPPFFSLLAAFRRQFEAVGLLFTVHPFFGVYKGQKYPDSYNEKERQMMRPSLGNKDGRVFETKTVYTKGKLCLAGSRYGIVHSNGNVSRCGAYSSGYGKPVVGNIFDDNFRLWDEPAVCDYDECVCNEWQSLLEEKNGFSAVNL